MAEFGRVAQTTIRSTRPLFQAAPIRSQLCRSLVLTNSISGLASGGKCMSTASSLRSANGPVRPTRISSASPSRTQRQPYSSGNWGWSNPGRDVRGSLDNIDDMTTIKKPNSAAYNLVSGDSKEKAKDDEESAGLTFDMDIDMSDFGPKGVNDLLPAPHAHVRLVPRTGRTVHVKTNVDVARSFKLLAHQVAQNKLRYESHKQKFHERPGLKRKRLKSERWQKRFKQGFKATVSRVRALTAQGW